MASPSLVQQASTATSAASPTSITPTLGAASIVGNFLLLVVCVTGTSPTITAPAGWTVLRNSVSNAIANAMFVIASNAGGITGVAVTVGGTGGGAAASIFEFSGVTSSVLESSFANANAGSTLPRSQFPTNVPQIGEFLFSAVYFAAATVNNLTGTTAEWSAQIGAAVSTSGVPNAQLTCLWGMSTFGDANPNIALTLGTSVAWVVFTVRFYISGSQQASYANVSGLAGVYVGQFNQGMIGG